MMNMIEEAIIYATVLHQGTRRKTRNIPAVLHPLEVAQILATMTEDHEIITAGILHDILEDTGTQSEEIRKRFGERVAMLVESESEPEFPDLDKEKSWKKRKELSLLKLKTSTDIGVKMLWLADKLANIRSLARDYSETGDQVWQHFHQSDPALQCWYYRTAAEYIELDLNRSGAFKELIKHINYIWPGTFDSEKAKYKKYREVSVDGCRLLGKGLKGDVYRYDDELILKVYNRNNTYRDVEREIALSRRAFVLGVPTAISFGIVSVGEQYGAMYELVEADTLTGCILHSPSRLDYYAGIMADVARQIHSTKAQDNDPFPDARERVREYILNGVARSDKTLADRCLKLVDQMPATRHLIHGDFHTSNVFLQNSEPLLIDMDRLATGDPVIELGDIYMYYIVPGEKDGVGTDPYLGISFQLCRRFFRIIMERYLQTQDENRIREAVDKAELLGNLRRINRLWKSGTVSPGNEQELEARLGRTEQLADRIRDLRIFQG